MYEQGETCQVTLKVKGALGFNTCSTHVIVLADVIAQGPEVPIALPQVAAEFLGLQLHSCTAQGTEEPLQLGFSKIPVAHLGRPGIGVRAACGG